MVSERNRRPHSSESRTYRVMTSSKPELEEFYESVHDRMKNLAIARKAYKGRNDKELSVHKGEIFEVLDDEGAWWCLRAPSGKAGHVPKYNLEIIENPVKSNSLSNDTQIDPIIVKVPVVIKTSLRKEKLDEPAPSVITQPPPKNVTETVAEKQPEVRTVLREITRPSTEPQRYKETRYRPSARVNRRRKDSLSTSETSDSDFYENEPRKNYARGRAQQKPSQFQRPRASTMHCGERHSCCQQKQCCNRQEPYRRPETVQTQPEQQSGQLQQSGQQQQPMIIILEPPKQEVEEQFPEEDYTDPYQQPQINIMLTPGQFGQMPVSQPYSMYGQMAQPMQWPIYY